jgi:hypothetical protein
MTMFAVGRLLKESVVRISIFTSCNETYSFDGVHDFINSFFGSYMIVPPLFVYPCDSEGGLRTNIASSSPPHGSRGRWLVSSVVATACGLSFGSWLSSCCFLGCAGGRSKIVRTTPQQTSTRRTLSGGLCPTRFNGGSSCKARFGFST